MRKSIIAAALAVTTLTGCAAEPTRQETEPTWQERVQAVVPPGDCARKRIDYQVSWAMLNSYAFWGEVTDAMDGSLALMAASGTEIPDDVVASIPADELRGEVVKVVTDAKYAHCR